MVKKKTETIACLLPRRRRKRHANSITGIRLNGETKRSFSNDGDDMKQTGRVCAWREKKERKFHFKKKKE